MSTETEFVDGLIVKAPHDNAPEYVKAKLSLKRTELIAWLQSREGDWVNLDLKVSQNGKWYAAVDNWKPNQGGAPKREAPKESAPAAEFDPENIPF